MTNTLWTKLASYSSRFCCDTVEWCPIPTFENIFACGTYELMENETVDPQKKRIGELLLFTWLDNLNLLQTVQSSAILDIKWSHKTINNCVVLATAEANGNITLYKLNAKPQLEILTTINIGEDRLCLSLDWNNALNNDAQIIVSDSKGFVTIVECADERNLEIKRCWHGHDFEAWICCFNYWDTSVVLSGGDDCKLKLFDVRINMDSQWVKKFEAGVTSLHCNYLSENLVLVGSYDETANLLDLRQPKTFVNTLKLSGGVWRLKWEPEQCRKILAACMYGSFHVVDFDENRLSNVAEYDGGHKSIAYGADWSRLDLNSSKLIATCSFYDKLLTVSRVDF